MITLTIILKQTINTIPSCATLMNTGLLYWWQSLRQRKTVDSLIVLDMLQKTYLLMSYLSVSAQECLIMLPFIRMSQYGTPVVHPHVALNVYPEDTDLTISAIGQVMFEPCWNIRPGN